ncbi:hypothetical protein GWI33_014058 [Rhynchophorus ferrugineus]|uniref:Pacifastin domain-containing protein n=1 Tax=Rhynchophorus ferrugineus TaxID=354439 RepID=A0A834I848_RHYFE|nr:hypothetical protein GWI33_014058 [Rhynchophorus ferrugineus]
MWTKRLLLGLFSVCLFVDVGSSICKPLSFFKVDCNICLCDASGKQYSCERKICQRVPDYTNFIKELDKDGRVILIPKSSHQSKIGLQDDFTYNTKISDNKSNSKISKGYDDFIKSFLT